MPFILRLSAALVGLACLPAAQAAASGPGTPTVGASPDTYVTVSGNITAAYPGYERTAGVQESGQQQAFDIQVRSSGNLQTGVLSAYVESRGTARGDGPQWQFQGSSNSAGVRFSDQFTVLPGALPGAEAVLHVQAHATFSGLGAIPSNNGVLLEVGWYGQEARGSETASLHAPVSPLDCSGLADGTAPASCSLPVSYRAQTQFALRFALPAAGESFRLGGSLRAQAVNGGTVDMTDGWTMWLELPAGAALEPQSILFPMVAVPEPSSAWMALAGGVALGLLRRRAATKRTAGPRA